MERNAEQKKPDLKTWTARCRSRAGQPAWFFNPSEASKLIPSEDHLGIEGVEHWGWAGAWGKQTRLFLFGEAAALARTMPANWRADCPHEREVRISSQRDSEAAVRHTTPYCATFFPRRGAHAKRGVAARQE